MASVHVERLDYLGLIACMIKDLDLISMIDARLRSMKSMPMGVICCLASWL